MENVLHAPAQRRAGNRTATLAACVLAAFALLVVVAAGIALYGQATVTDFTAKNLAPSLEHPFGTDWMGRDMLARTLAGLSTSVLVGLLAATVSSVIALILGCAAALGGKRVDAVVSWMIDLMMGVPHIVLLVLISFALGKGFWGVTIGVAVTHWPSLARVVRAEVLQCRQSKFVEVARKLGQSPARIALRHMVPYVLPQFVVGLILLFPHAILHEASITIFGLRPAARAAGHRRDLERIDELSVHGRLVAGGVPRPGAHGDGAVVRRGRAEPAQAGRPAYRAKVGGEDDDENERRCAHGGVVGGQGGRAGA